METGINDNRRPIEAMSDQELKQALLTLRRIEAGAIQQVENGLSVLGKAGVAIGMVNAELDRRYPATRAN
jgi:hypothetical protein